MKRKNVAVMLALVVLISLLAACGSRENNQTTLPTSDADTNAPSGTDTNVPDDTDDDTDTNTPGSTEKNSESDGWKNLSIDTTDLNGTEITEENFSQNKLTILNVWATWCPSCIAELPELQKISEAFADQGVQVVGVVKDGVSEGVPSEKKIENAQKLLEDAGASYTVILPDETLTAEFISQMQSFPTTFFIDSEGTVVHTVIGAKNFEDWSDEINEVLSEISS